MGTSIKNVKKFLFYQEGIMFLAGEINHRDVFYWNNSNSELLIKDSIIPSFKEYRENIILYFPEKSILIDKYFNKIEFDRFIVEFIVNEKNYIGYKIEYDDKEFLCYYSGLENKIKWLLEDKLFPYLSVNNKLICKKIISGVSYMVSISITSGIELWQFSIQDFPPYINGFFREQEADIKQIIGVYNNLLWIHVGGFRLVGIDINTGKMIHHIENVLDLLALSKEERYHVNLDDTVHLNEQQGILKAFAHRYYFEIDLNILQGRIKKDFGPKWNPDWRIRHSNYYQEYPNLLFFCGYYKATDAPNAFGIFDTELAEIIWYDTTKDDSGYFYNPPQANDKLLAILDDKHNLLVYERNAI